MALSSLLQYGRKRRRLYFPDNIQGTFPLSRGEIVDDIDQLSALDLIQEPDSPTDSPLHPGLLRSSKRSKLVKKVLNEINAAEDLGNRQRELRGALDSLRDENAKLQLAIDRKNKELYRLTRERQRKEQAHKTMQVQYQAKLDQLNHDTHHHQRALSDLKQSIISLTQKSTGFLREVTDISGVREKTIEFDKRYNTLEMEFQDRDRRLKAASDLFNQTSRPDYSQARLENWTKLEEAYKELRKVQTEYSDLVHKQNEDELSMRQLKSENQKYENLIGTMENENSQLKSRIQEIEKVMEMKEKNDFAEDLREEFNKTIADLQDRVAYFEELAESKAQLIECADARSTFAERSLQETFKKMVVLENAIKEQQAKYDQLLEQTKKWKEKNTELEMKFVEMKRDNAEALEMKQNAESDCVNVETKLKGVKAELDNKQEELDQSFQRIKELEAILKDKDEMLVAMQQQSAGLTQNN